VSRCASFVMLALRKSNQPCACLSCCERAFRRKTSESNISHAHKQQSAQMSRPTIDFLFLPPPSRSVAPQFTSFRFLAQFLPRLIPRLTRALYSGADSLCASDESARCAGLCSGRISICRHVPDARAGPGRIGRSSHEEPTDGRTDGRE